MPIYRDCPRQVAGNDPETYRALNRERARHGLSFHHPPYPPPYERFPECCFLGYEERYGHLPRSRYSDLLRVTVSPDPYSPTCLALAEERISAYRVRVTYPSWSDRIGDYPVPDWLNGLALQVAEKTYCHLELETAHLVEWLFEVVLDLVVVRGLVVGCLKQSQNPCQVVRAVWMYRKGRPLENAPAYFLAMARKRGERPPLEASEDEPITRVIRPSLAEAIPGWTDDLPPEDRLLAEETSCFLQGAGMDWHRVLEVTEVGCPTATPGEWIAQVRATIDPIRAKIKANKLSRWSR